MFRPTPQARPARRGRRSAALAAGLVALGLVAAACGSSSSSTTTTAGGATTTAGGGSATTGGGNVSGSITVTGSSTVEPISRAVADAFGQANPGATISVSGPGTGDGFETFCAGEAEVTGASRPIKDAEIEKCKANGVEFVELMVGSDGITVATSPENSAVSCLDFPALYALVGPESLGVNTWNGANTLAGQLGSKYANLPDAPLVITGPGEESGTYDFFVEKVVTPIAKNRSSVPENEKEATRPDYQASPNDSVIVEGIEGTPTSLGWLGYAFYKEEGQRMKAIEVDGGKGCVAPTDATILDGTYPLSRPLFIYVNKAKAGPGTAVGSYVDYYLSPEGIAKVGEVGFVALPPEKLAETQATWTAR